MSKKKTPVVATESLHLTFEDGTVSLADLIKKQTVGSVLPEKPIASFHFIVSPFHSSLVFPRVVEFQPEGFEWGILPGQDKKFKATKVDLPAAEALEFFLVASKGNVCNFLLVMEFYD